MTSHEIGVLILALAGISLILWAAFSTANIKPNKPQN